MIRAMRTAASGMLSQQTQVDTIANNIANVNTSGFKKSRLSFRSLLYYAAWTVDDAPDELPRAISLAKGYASDAFTQIGIDAVQLHGAIGFTAEYDIQLYLKRSKWARPMYGDTDYHYERVALLGDL